MWLVKTQCALTGSCSECSPGEGHAKFDGSTPLHREGAKAAVTHTGALAGADAVYDAAFRRAGLSRGSDLDEKAEGPRLDSKRTFAGRSFDHLVGQVSWLGRL
jgi:Succinyl-CoA ligase like flavodoxin domain